MNVFTLGSYVYGTYVNFAMGSEGGGGGTNPSAQTGDFLMSMIIIAAALIFLAALAVVIFVKLKKNYLASKAVSNAGSITKSLMSKKIIALIVVALIVAVAAASLSAKAFAEANYDRPSAPSYSTATGTMDKSTNTVTVPTVTIVDENVKATGKCALIGAFSIKGLDQFANKDLGNWTVKIDDYLAYSGKVNTLKPCPFITKESGEFKIDISATDVPTDVMDALNGNMGVLVEFGNGADGAINVIDKEEQPKATVALSSESPGFGYQEFSIASGREDEFKQLIEENGWEDKGSKTYEKKFDFYTNYNDILSIWNDAIADGLLVNDNQFYKWDAAINPYTNILLINDSFKPVWLPEPKPVTFHYMLGLDVELTAYGQSMLQEKGWQLKEDPSVGGDEYPKYIEGTATNVTDVSEINNVLTSECFIFANDVLNGWAFNYGKIFEHIGNDDIFTNQPMLSPITVILGGMVIDETGKGMPNICVVFKPLGGAQEQEFQAQRRSSKAIFPTITDSNGNYWLPVDKGLTGVMFYGFTLFDNTDNDWSGKSLLLENVQTQNIPTIVVREKIKLHFQKQDEPDASNKQILDYGSTKFVNSKGEVFYQSTSDAEGIIEVCAHDSGKLIYESALYYGEVDIADTSLAVDPVKLIVKAKDPKTDSDCVVKGVAYLWTSPDTKVPLANAHLTFILKSTVNSEYSDVEVDTNENGEYSFNGFQGAYINLVECTTSEGAWYESYKVVMAYGDVFEFDVNFADFE